MQSPNGPVKWRMLEYSMLIGETNDLRSILNSFHSATAKLRPRLFAPIPVHLVSILYYAEKASSCLFATEVYCFFHQVSTCFG